MASPLQLAYRTQKIIGLFDAAPIYEPLAGFSKPEGTLRCDAYSPCGRYFAWASPDVVNVVSTTSGAAILKLPLVNAYELGFSPRGNFLITWERPSKDEAGDATKNLKVWLTEETDIAPGDKQPIGRFVQKQQGGWNLQYTADEAYCARLVTNKVQFFESHNLTTVWNKLRAEGVTNFALAPGSQNHAVAVFVPERKGQPAVVKVYNVPLFDTCISQKTFFKGDKVQLKWNKLGSSIIVLAQTDVDRSGKSYYGETTLYLLSTNGSFNARVTLDKEGPIHDVSWSPNSRELGVVYGYMPAKATVFSDRAVAKHIFPLCPRNTVTFSPSGRFVLVAGFGNLAGQIDVYDLDKDYGKVCTIESGNPSVCEWSPDSRYIMTATTSPRLRVDNGIKLWHVSGAIMYSEDMVELYNVQWRPGSTQGAATGDPLKPVPPPHASATAYLGRIKTPSKPAGAYRPPGARGVATPLHFKREDEGGAAHQVTDGTPSIGPNGYGRSRRAVPGAEPLNGVPSAPARMVPGVDPTEYGNGGAKKSKKSKKPIQELQPESEAAGGVSLMPPYQDFALGFPGDDRSFEQRLPPNGGMRDHRSRSRPNGAGGSPSRLPPDPQDSGVAQANRYADTHVAANLSSAVEGGAQNPNAKKLRSLQKKIRAIEDLEMRFAGGEKLEDTQLKKITTKSAVLRELQVLEME